MTTFLLKKEKSVVENATQIEVEQLNEMCISLIVVNGGLYIIHALRETTIERKLVSCTNGVLISEQTEINETFIIERMV